MAHKSLCGIQTPCPLINTLSPRQNGSHVADVIFKFIIVYDGCRIVIHISKKFVPKIPINITLTSVQIVACVEQATILYTHIGVTRLRSLRGDRCVEFKGLIMAGSALLTTGECVALPRCAIPRQQATHLTMCDPGYNMIPTILVHDYRYSAYKQVGIDNNLSLLCHVIAQILEASIAAARLARAISRDPVSACYRTTYLR